MLLAKPQGLAIMATRVMGVRGVRVLVREEAEAAFVVGARRGASLGASWFATSCRLGATGCGCAGRCALVAEFRRGSHVTCFVWVAPGVIVVMVGPFCLIWVLSRRFLFFVSRVRWCAIS